MPILTAVRSPFNSSVSLCKILLMLLCAYSAATPVLAAPIQFSQQINDSNHALNKLSDEPVHTEIIDAEALQNQNATNLQSALKYANSILLRDIHGKAGQAAWIQGFSGAHVLVLVDGEKVTATTDSGVDLTQVSINDIERIEIVKGAGSALYGSSAVGGVINVITKRGKMGLHGGAVLQAGEHFSQRRKNARTPADYFAGVNLAYRQEKYSVHAAIDERNSDGYSVTATKPANSRFGEQGHRRNMLAAASLSPVADHSFYLRAKRYEEDISQPIIDALPGIGNIQRHSQEYVADDRISIGASLFKFSNHNLSMAAYKEKFTNKSRHKVARDTQIDSDHFKLQYDYHNARQDGLIVGMEAMQEKISQSNNGVSEFTSARPEFASQEAYVQYDTFISEAMQVLLGARSHHSSINGSHLMPKLALMYYLNWGELAQKLRFNYGAGYRVASIKEKYYLFDHSVYGYKVLGNPNLDPEKSQSLQLGYELQGSTGNTVYVNLFYTKIKDLIDSDYVGMEGSNKIFKNVNRQSVYTSGLELNFHKQQQLAHAVLSFDGGYTYLYSKNQSTAHYGKTLPKRPKHVVKLRASYRQGRAEFALGMRHSSSQFDDAANKRTLAANDIVDFKFNYALKPNLSLYLGIDNLFNSVSDPDTNDDAAPPVGRFTYVGTRFSF